MKAPQVLLFLLFYLLPLVSTGQTACDSLEIVSVTYTPLVDTLVQVHVRNNSSNLFNYPSFVLLNAQGDTVAREDVNFFGIGGEQTHFMELRAGMPLTNAFTGRLELWSGFSNQLECFFNLDFDLCPHACSKIVVGIYNLGSFTTEGDFIWSLLDDQS